MRRKNKLLCDNCGSEIRVFTDKEMIEIQKDANNGTRTNCSIICGRCKFKMLNTGRKLR